MSSTPYRDRTEAQKESHLEYNRRWRKSHIEYSRKWRESHRKPITKEVYCEEDIARRKECKAEVAKKRYVRQKQEAITLLGGECVRCRCDDMRCLEIDHIIPVHGDRSLYGAKLYRSIVNGGSTENLQVLCANCHAIKSYEDGNG